MPKNRSNVTPTAVKKIIAAEQRKNKEVAEVMLSSFTNETRQVLDPTFLDNIEQMIARHLESFLPPQAAMAVASNIVNDMRGTLTDMVNDTQDNAIKLVESYTSHFAMQIKRVIKNYDQEICWCIDCHPNHKQKEK